MPGATGGPACNRHDVCYQTRGSDQGRCDFALREEIINSCTLAYPLPCPHLNDGEGSKFTSAIACQDYKSERKDCNDIADWFYKGLSPAGTGINENWSGEAAFKTRQVQYCECCK